MTVVAGRLGDWLQGHVLFNDPAEIAPFQAAVEKLGAQFASAESAGLVAFAHALPEAPAEVEATIAKAAAETNIEQPVHGGLARALGAAALADVLERYDTQQAIIAALATGSLNFAGAAAALGEIPDLAQAARTRISRAVRQVSLEPVALRAVFDANIETLPAVDAGPGAARIAAQEARKTTRAVAGAAQTAINALVANVNRISEEIDLLWWTVRPFSPHLPDWTGRPGAVTLVSAVEIAKRIRADPPPEGVELIIDDVLTKGAVTPGTALTIEQLRDDLPGDLDMPPIPDGLAWAMPVLHALADGRDLGRRAASDWAAQTIAEASFARAVNS